MATATQFLSRQPSVDYCQPRSSILPTPGIWSWIKRRPTDTILIVGWALFAVYLAIYFGSGAWRLA